MEWSKVYSLEIIDAYQYYQSTCLAQLKHSYLRNFIDSFCFKKDPPLCEYEDCFDQTSLLFSYYTILESYSYINIDTFH